MVSPRGQSRQGSVEWVGIWDISGQVGGKILLFALIVSLTCVAEQIRTLTYIDQLKTPQAANE